MKKTLSVLIITAFFSVALTGCTNLAETVKKEIESASDYKKTENDPMDLYKKDSKPVTLWD